MAKDAQVHNDNGFALVVVLLVLLLVTALAAELVFTVRTGVQEGVQVKQQTLNRGLAKAGVNLALFHLLDQPLDFAEDGPYIQGTTRSVYLAAGKVEFQIVNESGKMDLSRINRPLLSQFLQQQGYRPDEQEILIDSLEDWIDTDDLHRLNGAEDDYYETLTVPYRCKNGPFTDPAELLMVRGAEKLNGRMNPADFFTLHNPGGRINFNALTPSLLHTLVSGDEERIQQYRELKQDGVPLQAVHAQLILDGDYGMWQPYLVYSTGKNRYYSVIATGFAGAGDIDEKKDSSDTVVKNPGCRIRLLLELRGSTLRYIRWSEESIVE